MTKRKTSRGNHASPISVRLTHEERQLLETAAKGSSLSNYIRAQLFTPHKTIAPSPKETSRLSSLSRQRLLAQLLSEFGQSNIAQSLSNLAHAVSRGHIELDDEQKEQLAAACADIAVIRRLLLKALGLRQRGER